MSNVRKVGEVFRTRIHKFLAGDNKKVAENLLKDRLSFVGDSGREMAETAQVGDYCLCRVEKRTAFQKDDNGDNALDANGNPIPGAEFERNEVIAVGDFKTMTAMLNEAVLEADMEAEVMEEIINEARVARKSRVVVNIPANVENAEPVVG